MRSTGSTNTDLVARATAGKAAEGAVLVAEEQTAGPRPAGPAVDGARRAPACSSPCCCKPTEVPVTRWGWLPLLAGVAAATGLSRAGGRRHGTQMAQRPAGDVGRRRSARPAASSPSGPVRTAVVIGIGINVSLRADELPVPDGRLAGAGGRRDHRPRSAAAGRAAVAGAVVRAVAGGGAATRRRRGLQETYAAGCATLGRTVRAELPGDRSVVGEAVAVDGDGRLVLATGDGVQEPVGAGDVVHLRPAR